MIQTIVFTLIAFLNVVYQFGFDSAYLRLANDEDGEGRKRLFSTAFWSQALGAIGLLRCCWRLSGRAPGALMVVPEPHLGLFLLRGRHPPAGHLTVVPMAHLRLTHSAMRFSLISLGQRLRQHRRQPALRPPLGQGLEGVFWANLVASAFTLLLVPAGHPVANLRSVPQQPISGSCSVSGCPWCRRASTASSTR